MKKVFITILIVLSSVMLFGCGFFSNIFNPYQRIEGALDFENLSTEYDVSNGYLNIYYPNETEIPYVEVNEFIRKLKGAINTEYIVTEREDDKLATRIRGSMDGKTISEFGLVCDFSADTILIETFDFFDYLPAQTETDFGEGLSVTSTETVSGNEVTIDLKDYGIDIINDNDKYLMPFHLTNLLYSGGMYNVYFNGNKVYGVDSYQISNANIINTIRVSSYNVAEMSLEYKEYNYNFLMLAFDYFYGLKTEILGDKNSFKEHFDLDKFNIISGNDKNTYQGVNDFLITLDDLHSSYIFPGIYESSLYYLPADNPNKYGPRTTRFYDAVQELRDKVAGRELFTYLDNGKTLIIYFTSFDVQTVSEIRKELKQINSSVENIVVDLSYNTGGNLGVTMQLLGFMTDLDLPLSIINPQDGSKVTQYFSTTDRAVNKNWYVLTSPITFSAANLMTSIAKENNLATIIGQKSGGGACATEMVLLPDGSCIVFSSNTKLTNEDYASIEYGIDVDNIMNDVSSRNELLNIINNLK